MISNYEDDLTRLTDKPKTIEAQQSVVLEEMSTLSKNIAVMEGRLTKTSSQRKEIYDRYQVITQRSNELTELLDRFKLLDAQGAALTWSSRSINLTQLNVHERERAQHTQQNFIFTCMFTL